MIAHLAYPPHSLSPPLHLPGQTLQIIFDCSAKQKEKVQKCVAYFAAQTDNQFHKRCRLYIDFVRALIKRGEKGEGKELLPLLLTVPATLALSLATAAAAAAAAGGNEQLQHNCSPVRRTRHQMQRADAAAAAAARITMPASKSQCYCLAPTRWPLIRGKAHTHTHTRGRRGGTKRLTTPPINKCKDRKQKQSQRQRARARAQCRSF